MGKGLAARYHRFFTDAFLIVRQKRFPSRAGTAFISLLAVVIIDGLIGTLYAADSTAAGVVAARATDDTSVLVRMPYTGDDNGNNTYTVEYKPCSSGTYTPWVTNAPHTASPYRTTITELTPNACYNIRATYNDGDGVAGTGIQTIQITSTWDNTLLHNMNRFITSTKWEADGGWGLPGTRYGQIVCETCHVRMSSNIKGIAGTITSPDGTDQFPGQAGGLGILFQSVTTPDGFGDDMDPSGHVTSQKVCEYCHSQTNYHRYDTSGQAKLNHNNNADCTQCHPHSVGFYYAIGCDSCHGNPPVAGTLGGPNGLANAPATGSRTAGAHSFHATSSGRNYSCDICHHNSAGSGAMHKDNRISLGFVDIFGPSTYTGGAYDGQTTANYESTDPGTAVSNSGSKSCSNIYCHGSTMAPNGGTNVTPTWDDPSTGACGTCHGATASNPPRRGAHYRHTALTTDIGHEYACALCHKDPSTDQSLHVNNKSEVRFSSDPKVAGGTYSGTETMLDAYGNCSNVYCHSNVQTSPPGGPPTYKSVNWSDQFASDPNCSLCHEGSTTHYTVPVAGNTTGSHPKHAAANIYCGTCHANDVTQVDLGDMMTGGCIVCHTTNGPNVTHANGVIDVNIVNVYGGSYSGTPTPGDAYGSCSTTYCHSSGQHFDGGPLQAGDYQNPIWGGAVLCGDCHKTTTGTTLGRIDSGSHPAHLDRGAICESCHTGAGTGILYNSMLHLNKLIDVSNGYTAGGAPGNGYGTCTTAYCHSNGAGGYTQTPTWGAAGSVHCGDCHAVPPATASHTLHTGNLTSVTAAYGSTTDNPSDTQYGFNCGQCHPLDPARHANGTLEVEVVQGGMGLKAKNSPSAAYNKNTDKTCTGVYCHSDGKGTLTIASPAWNGSFSGDKCAGCHKNSPDSTPHGKHVVGIHYYNIYSGTVGLATAVSPAQPTNSHGHSGTSTTINCNICHNSTVTSSANDQNTVCATCHDGTNASLKGNAAIASKIFHVNGSVDVAFVSSSAKSRAQIRSLGVPELSNNWTRADYKTTGPNPYDTTKSPVNSATYDTGDKGCNSVACHNGYRVKWTDAVSCGSCHKALP